jgi:hypothetical protein
VLATWVIRPDRRSKTIPLLTRVAKVDNCLDFNEIPDKLLDSLGNPCAGYFLHPSDFLGFSLLRRLCADTLIKNYN